MRAAVWPVAVLLILAVAFAIPSYDQGDEVVVGFGDRMGLVLALLLQGLGGGFEISGVEPGSDYDGGFSPEAAGAASLSLAPLMVTALWIVALVIGVRTLRTRLVARGAYGGGGTPGLEAAVRVTVLVTAAVLVLGLFAQPTVVSLDVSSSPHLSALGALLLGGAVSFGVLHRDDLAGWLSVRPGVGTLFRATGTAVRALAVVLTLCSLVALVSIAQIDDLNDGWDGPVHPLVLALLVLPNLAVMALGLSWGASVEAEAGGGTSMYGSGYEREAFGLSELGDAVNAWAVVGALALGVVCALTVGVVAARRSANRGEQLLSAGVFFGFFLLLAGLGGLSTEMSGSAASDIGGELSGAGTVAVGLAVPEALLFGLLWIAGAAFLAPYLMQMAGARTGTGLIAAPIPAMPSTPAGWMTPTGPGPGLGVGPSAGPSGPAGVAASTPVAPVGPSDAPVGPSDAPMGPSAVSAGTPAVGANTPENPVNTPNASSEPPLQGPASAPLAPAPAPHFAYDPHTVQLGHRPPSSTAPKPRSRALVWTVTLVVAFVVGGGAAAGVLVWQDHQTKDTSNKPKSQPTPAASESPGPSDTPSASTEPTPDSTSDSDSDSGSTSEPTDGSTLSDAEAPDGYHRLTDPMGFSFAVPDVWGREGVKNGTQVTYAGSTGLEHIQVGVIANADYTSYENFLTLEKTAKRKNDNYQRIKLEENTFQGRAGAIWEYTYTDESGRTIHAKDQGYVAENGTEYAIMIVGKEDVWDSGLKETFQIALETWELA